MPVRTSMLMPAALGVKQFVRHGVKVEMKVIITQAEAMQKNIWDDIMLMFGRTDEDEVWDTEQFILTEEQARKLGLLK